MQDFLRVPRQAFVDSKPRYTGLSTAATPSKATRQGNCVDKWGNVYQPV